MNRGYVKLWRKVSDNPLWTDSKFTPGQAWVDLIMLANHKPGHIRIRGIRVDVPRGYCGWSQTQLAARWRWSRGRVIRFLRELETVQQIEQQKTNITTLIKINNYDEYQSDDTANRAADGPQTDRRRYTNKNEKNEKNEKNINIYSDERESKNGSALKTYPYPDWLNRSLWSDFHKMRSKIKKPITTERTIKGLLITLEKLISDGYPQDEIIQSAVDGCWLTFYKPKNNQICNPQKQLGTYNGLPKCPYCGDVDSRIMKGSPCPTCNKEVI